MVGSGRERLETVLSIPRALESDRRARNGWEWSGMVGSGRERTVLSIPRALRVPIEGPGMVGSGREWSGVVGSGPRGS